MLAVLPSASHKGKTKQNQKKKAIKYDAEFTLPMIVIELLH